MFLVEMCTRLGCINFVGPWTGGKRNFQMLLFLNSILILFSGSFVLLTYTVIHHVLRLKGNKYMKHSSRFYVL